MNQSEEGDVCVDNLEGGIVRGYKSEGGIVL